MIPKFCPACREPIVLQGDRPPSFCPYCGHLIAVELPQSDLLLANRYQILDTIGKGGMGEVFLAFDTICGRQVALKKIRSDLLDHPQIRHRFLKEAHITCQLSHPSIIPIYSIQSDQTSAFYTMPYQEGETLKQIIRKTRQQQNKGEKIDQIGGSIPALMRIFISICQAIAYAHAKGVLHRDLKPENVIIGKYGETLILDWGLAKFIDSPPTDDELFTKQPAIPKPQHAEITRIGKIVGTLTYMAPEIAQGKPSTVQTDIYALGVILYQLLTLKTPFKRKSLTEYRRNPSNQEFIDPVIAAPYRDVPRILSRITEKCLENDPNNRYLIVDDLIYELENYLEGRSDWFHVAELDIKHKEDWEFQEHVLISDHMAITRFTEETQWVHLMISKQSFSGNVKIETTVTLGNNSKGIGLLFSIPEASQRTSLSEGYYLWLGTDLERSTVLMQSNVEVMQAPDIFLKRLQPVQIRIEKVEKTIHFFLDNTLQFSYIGHLPLIGTHIGFLSRDTDFTISPLEISVGSLNLTVNCLAVPDAFLSHGDFSKALSEYQRIAYSFPDRSEGREAQFRTGLTYLQQAKHCSDSEKEDILDKAFQEFEKLHSTPGGPLEYLGKALICQMQNDEEEEIKCFEIAYRRYPKHPLLPMLQEQILSRMHEISRYHRNGAFRFILFALRHFSPRTLDTHTKRLLTSLQKHVEPLAFIEQPASRDPSILPARLATELAFWLGKPYVLSEIIDELVSSSSSDDPKGGEIANGLFCLIELGSVKYAKKKFESVSSSLPALGWQEHQTDLAPLFLFHEGWIEEAIQQLPLSSEITFSRLRTLLYLTDSALDQNLLGLAHRLLDLTKIQSFPSEMQTLIDCRRIWTLLTEKKWQEAGELIDHYGPDVLDSTSSPLHFLYGCWLQATEGSEMAMIHFMGLLHVSYPRTWNLASSYILGELSENNLWYDHAFLWEKRELYRQLSLYYHCLGNEEKVKMFKELYTRESIDVEDE